MAVINYFSDFGRAVARGDWSVKLTLLWMGAGCARRKQYARAVIMTILELAVIAFTVGFAMRYVPKFGTLGTVTPVRTFHIETMKNEFNDYDNSFQILLFSLFSFVVWAASFFVWMGNVIHAWRLQLMEEAGEHIKSFKEELISYKDKF